MRSTERFDAIRHDDLDAVAPLWDRFETEGFATAFQTRPWLKAIQETLAKGKKAEFFVVEVREHGTQKPLLLLPFCRRQCRGVSVIEFVSFGVCDLAMPVMGADEATSGTAVGATIGPGEARSLWQAVLAVLPRADLIKVDQIPPQYRGRQNPLSLLAGVLPAAQQRYEAPLNADPSRVVETMASTKMRQNLKRSERRLSDLGDIQFLAAETEQDLEMCLAAMFRQRQDRFRELGRFDFLAQPEVQAFYQAVARQHLEGAGSTRLWALLVNHEPVATCLGLVHANTLHCLVITMKGGAWERCSPALVLISRLLVWCRENEVNLIDFSVGDGYHKTGFGGKPQMMLEYRSALTRKGTVLLACAMLAGRGKAWIRAHPHLFETARRAVQGVRRLVNRRRQPEGSEKD